MPAGAIRAALDSLGLPIRLEVERVKRCGFAATKATVHAKDEESYRFLPDVEAILANGELSASGETLGLNAGAFFAVSRIMSMGGLVRYTVRDPSQRCQTPQGGMKQCVSGNYAAENVLAFHAGLLF